MRAIRVHEFGPPENLSLDELPDLTAAAGQVRIAVEASGVHLVGTTNGRVVLEGDGRRKAVAPAVA